MGKQAAIYARVSTEEQTTNYSLPGQIEDCRKYAAEKDYSVIAEYQEAFSGALLFRPELDKLRLLIGSIDVLVVYELDRLSRNAAHLTIIEDEFKRGGVVVEYVVGYADTPEGQLMKTIQAGIKEYEREVIKGRTTLGKKRRAKSGKVNLGICAPYGYTINKQAGQLEIEPEEAHIVRLIFKLYTIGDETGKPLGITAIASRLTDMGITTKFAKGGHPKKMGRTVWASRSVLRILTNETYIGTWYGNRHECIRTPEGRHVALRPREEWIAVSAPAIIDNATFEAAQRQKEDNYTYASRNTQHEYLLRQRMTCATCGHPFHCETRYNTPYIKGGKGTSFYICGGERRRTNDGVVKVCRRSLWRDDVDTLVWKQIVSALQHPDVLLKSVSLYIQQQETERDALRGYLQTVEGRVATLTQQQSRLLELYADAQIEKDILKQKMQEITDELARYKKEQAELQERLIDTEVVSLEEFYALCEHMAEGLEHLSFEEKRMIIDLFAVRVVVQRGERATQDSFTITGNLPVSSRIGSDH